MNNPISVSELNSFLKLKIESDSSIQNICVRGEISNLRYVSSGHIYFSLKDNNSVIKSIMFKGHTSKLRFSLSDGMKVLVDCSVSVYVRDGQYYLLVTNIIPDGIGELAIAYEQLKQKLALEGLFSPNHKKSLPRFPMKIALITSPTGAAIRDMIRILRTRWPIAKILVVPTRVQGDGSSSEIAKAIHIVNRLHAVDLIIVGRGGGSIEDLWAFNEEVVVREIYHSVIPVISAVGHETDTTLSDFSADVRASTPSNGAELAVPDQQSIFNEIEYYKLRLSKLISNLLDYKQNKLQYFSSNKVYLSPLNYIYEKELTFETVQSSLMKSFQYNFEYNKNKLYALMIRLDTLNPLNVLKRGYSMVNDSEGKIIRSVKEVNLKDSVSVSLSDGQLYCQVNQIIPEKGMNNGNETFV